MLPILLLLALTGRLFALTDPRDVYGLNQVKSEVLNNGASPEWLGVFESWVGDDPCGDTELRDFRGKWHGVECRYQESMPLDMPRRVTDVHIPEHFLKGPPPKSLALLDQLVQIDFDMNNMTGSLPVEYACLPNLIEIDFSGNNLFGSIPIAYGNGALPRLEQLKIVNNHNLQGCLPDGLPPFADKLCSETKTCTDYAKAHDDILLGTRVYGSRVSRYCSSSKNNALPAYLRNVPANGIVPMPSGGTPLPPRPPATATNYLGQTFPAFRFRSPFTTTNTNNVNNNNNNNIVRAYDGLPSFCPRFPNDVMEATAALYEASGYGPDVMFRLVSGHIVGDGHSVPSS